jgi:hypothetical protein
MYTASPVNYHLDVTSEVQVVVTLASPIRPLPRDVLYCGKLVLSVSEESVSSIFRAEKYSTLKMAAVRSSDTLGTSLQSYNASYPSKQHLHQGYTLLAPKILRWMLDFWKICAPLITIYMTFRLQGVNPKQ